VNIAVLDTMLFLLMVVGLTSPTYIIKHKRLAARRYSERDFTLLGSLISQTDNVVVTPNACTETSNWLKHGYIHDPARTQICMVFQNLIAASQEQYVSTIQASQRTEFERIGVTDSVLLEVAAENPCTLLTDDLPLYVAASSRGYKVVYFTHHREAIL
jgi:hypothetical protein